MNVRTILVGLVLVALASCSRVGFETFTNHDCPVFSAQCLGAILAERASEIGFKLVVGGFFACAYRNDGTDLRCFGDNRAGQLGIGDNQGRNASIGDEPGEMGTHLRTVPLPSETVVQHLAAGVHHACAILSNQQTVCWGGNPSGELGNGGTEGIGDDPGEMGDSLVPVELHDADHPRHAVALAVSGYSATGSACALLDNGKVKCWGVNDVGQLGHGNTTNHHGAVSIPYTELPTGRKAVAISGGRKRHFCALLDNQDVVCWGSNALGQLGIGRVGGTAAAIGDQPGEMGDNLVPVDLGQTDRIIAMSGAKCALFDDGRIKCWGANFIEDNTQWGAWPCGGVLGVGNLDNYGDEPDELGDNLPFVDFGRDQRAIALAPAVGNIMCAIMENHSLRCWGKNNYHGGLGTGTGRGAYHDFSGPTGNPILDGYYTPDCRGDDPDEIGDALPRIDLGTDRNALVALAGFDGACAILDNLTVKCWGTNFHGALGLELTPKPDITTEYHEHNGLGDDPGEMGDCLPTLDLGF